MAEYDLSQIFEDVVLRIDDQKFRLRERTHSLAAKAGLIRERLDALADDAADPEVAEPLMDLIDLLLEPVQVDGQTKRHAKTVLAKAYKQEEIGLDRLVAISGFLEEKFDDRRRPTSEMVSDG